METVKEAVVAWQSLACFIEKESRGDTNRSLFHEAKEKQCPYFLNKRSALEFAGCNVCSLRVPCGLTQGSSITIIGIPEGLFGDFRIDLVGEPLPCESDAPIILHYNVRLHGDKITKHPVIVQNTWIAALDWGEEERCPLQSLERIKNSLEPWLVSEARISGEMNLVSVVASGLPTSEDSNQILDLESLKSVTLPPKKPLELFIGVFSTTNNFKRRTAVRRTWMQYTAVRSGTVAVRFFIGLHKNQIVNEELLKEVHTYGDIQMMPFVDYYSVITWKTVAICIFGTQVVSANYVMKTDDDAFVRIDKVLASLRRADATHGLLYGLINSNALPHRSRESKWYISFEETGTCSGN